MKEKATQRQGPATQRQDPHTSLQYLVTATPKGCSLLASAVPTTASTFLRDSVAVSTSNRNRMTLGTPWVMVPVLSNITVFICKNNFMSGLNVEAAFRVPVS